MTTIVTSRFVSETDNLPKRKQQTWDEIVEELSTPLELSSKKMGQLFSPAVYDWTAKHVARTNDLVVKVSLLVYDLDHRAGLGEIQAALPTDLGYVVASSYSNTPTDPHYRLVVQLTEPIPRADFRDVWRRGQAFFGIEGTDEAAKDASRMYYLPAYPPGVEPETVVHAGSPLDWHALPVVEAPPEPARVTPDPDRQVDQELERKRALGFLAAMAGILAQAAPGDRHAVLLAKGTTAGGFMAAGLLEEDEIYDALLAAAEKNGQVGDYSQRKIENDIRDAIKHGAKKPVYPSDFGDSRDWGGYARASVNGHVVDPETGEVFEEPEPEGAQSPPQDAAASATVADDWPDPASLDGPPAAPVLRREWLPEVLWWHAEDVAIRQQSPVDFVVFTLLVLAATVIGRTPVMRMRDYDDWSEPAGLWVGNIGEPSSMKTPAQSAALRPLRRLEADANREYESAYAGWLERRDAAKKANQPVDRTDVEPSRQMWLTDDYTSEKLADLLQPDVSRGLAIVRDELGGVINSLNKYRSGGKGDDRQVLLEAYNGGPRTVNRVKTAYKFVPCLLVNIIGGIQPDLARLVFSSPDDKDHDGLGARFISILPDLGDWENTRRRPDVEVQEAWNTIVNRLAKANWALRLASTEEFDKPHTGFDREAQQIFDAWHAEVMHRIRGAKRSLDGPLAARVGKYPGLFGRLSMVIQLIEWASVPDIDKCEPRVCSGALAERVKGLFESYLLPMDKRVYEAYGTSRDGELGGHIAAWIKKHQAPRITVREARRAVRGKSDNEREIDSAVEWLCSQNWLREETTSTTPKRGRPSTEKFLVNPKVHQ